MAAMNQELRMTVINALPRQHAHHSDIKTISIFLEKNCCRIALSHKVKNCSAGFWPERVFDLGNAGGDSASPSQNHSPDPCSIPAISIAAVPQQWRDWTARSQAQAPKSVSNRSKSRGHCELSSAIFKEGIKAFFNMRNSNQRLMR